jgi:hypothetical protein
MGALRRRLERIECGARPAADRTVRNVIDRPPRETREQWLARKAAEERGELYDSGERNSRGETRTEWSMRRHRELDIPAIH